MVKKHTSIRIDEEYINVLKKNGLKLSTVVNELLEDYVGLLNSSQKQLSIDRTELIEKMEKDKVSLKNINKRLLELYEKEE